MFFVFFYCFLLFFVVFVVFVVFVNVLEASFFALDWVDMVDSAVECALRTLEVVCESYVWPDKEEGGKCQP